MSVVQSYIVPGQAHIVLANDKCHQWDSLNKSYKKIREEIENANPDLIVYCSTQWLSCLGYMMQGDAEPSGVHVDPNWHELGTLHYKFRVDTSFAEACGEEIRKTGPLCKVVNYKAFPIDTGTIVAQKLLNPENKFPCAMVSCSFYGDQEETINIGKALLTTLKKENKKAAFVLVSNFSNRYFTRDIDPKEDRISSVKDDEWNKKILGLLESGKLKDVVNLAKTFGAEAHADMGFKGIWCLYGILNEAPISAKIFDYQPVYGTGAALVGIYPSSISETKNHTSSTAPEAVGPYPHARKEGNFLFLSGIGPRKKGTKKIPGIEFDAEGKILSYDIATQTHSVFENVRTILEECGSSLDKVIDCQVFLTNMKDDFAQFNAVYKEYFSAETGPTRTTVEVGSLPTPIAVEFKIVACY